MKVHIVGGGPAGLYLAILMKRADPSHEVLVVERNQGDDTFGFGVVFSEATQENLAQADPETAGEMTRALARWEDIDIHYRGSVITSTGHGFAGIERRALLGILARRACELEVDLRFGVEMTDPAALGSADVVVAADGMSSILRDKYAAQFAPRLEWRPNRFVWLGTTRPFPAFTFFFKHSPHGLWRIHAYQYAPGSSTFIVETTDATWRATGLGENDEDATLAFCEALFAEELQGHRLLKNRSLWRRFPTVRNARWHAGNVVLLGDAAHTAHFSVGSGTKLAMEDAIALAGALHRHRGVPEALAAYEAERRPAVESLQRAAQVSLQWFEDTERYMDLEPIQFAFNLLTRSLRITHDNLRVRDPAFVAKVDRWFAQGAAAAERPAGAARPATAAPVHPIPPARPRPAQSRRGLADVPVQRGRRDAERLAPGAYRQPCHRRRRTGDDGDDRRESRGPDYPGMRRVVFPGACRGLEADRGVRPYPQRSKDRHATGPRGPEGLNPPGMGGDRRAA